MGTWTEFAEEVPEIAGLAERRLTATGLMMLATLRSDGFPRISPVEPVVAGDRLVLHDGRLWMGMMVDSTKSRDLRRDGRLGLHTATADRNVSEGDVKLWGTATEVTDHATLARFSDDIFESIGYRYEVGSFDAFDVDLLGASSVSVAGDVLYVTTWKPGKGVTVVEKRE
ncbi:MAG TPA: pyridoxamine 5'-phosphate oxidase family protein [Acidimicrobiales bacterium]|nr:pyridoxamine 5'-phosphate oxidase family protein [Acidimicrobiales bacterium]